MQGYTSHLHPLEGKPRLPWTARSATLKKQTGVTDSFAHFCTVLPAFPHHPARNTCITRSNQFGTDLISAFN